MKKKIAIIGASLSGLISSVVLKKKGYDVTIFEKTDIIGGLYSQVDTPFGLFELGMHVLYVNKEQQEILNYLYGSDFFLKREGVDTDLGGSYFEGKLSIGSIYPNVIGSKYSAHILEYLKQKDKLLDLCEYENVQQLLKDRFGEEYESSVSSPILKGLWGKDSSLLHYGAVHCFYDLRRAVVCGHEDAVSLKNNKIYNQVVAWPDQKKAKGTVYNDRCALFMKYDVSVPNVHEKLNQLGIDVLFEQNIEIKNNHIEVNDKNISDEYDAIFLSAPLHSMLNKNKKEKLEYVNLSIFYFELENDISKSLPVYYVLGHDEDTSFARLVNYDSYNEGKKKNVVSVEVVYSDEWQAPSVQKIIEDVEKIDKNLKVRSSYKFPISMKVPIPSVNNHNILEEQLELLKYEMKDKLLVESGMRTDLGRFFSHDTIKGAYDAAVEL